MRLLTMRTRCTSTSKNIESFLQLRIADENDEVVDIGVVGEVQAKNATAVTEYRNDPERTKKLFTADGFLKTGYVYVFSLVLFISLNVDSLTLGCKCLEFFYV